MAGKGKWSEEPTVLTVGGFPEGSIHFHKGGFIYPDGWSWISCDHMGDERTHELKSDAMGHIERKHSEDDEHQSYIAAMRDRIRSGGRSISKQSWLNKAGKR